LAALPAEQKVIRQKLNNEQKNGWLRNFA
jgi:hypothetical protein